MIFNIINVVIDFYEYFYGQVQHYTTMKRNDLVALFILILIVSIPIFAHLDVITIQLWDESRVGDHAIAMIRDNNWIVTTYHGAPDMWMTKPPLMPWLQALFIKIVGYNELAIRLPSALAALGTCILLFYLFNKKLKEYLPGMIAAIVLITVPGYVIYHGTRTGEYDSLVTMFMTGYAIFFFFYCEEKKGKYLSWTFAFLILAALTKGIQGVVFVPALLAYALYKKSVVAALKERQLYIGIAGFIVFVVGYYLLREHYNPGFIKTMQENEIGGRYNTVIEGHDGGPWAYLNQLVSQYFNNWYLLVIPGILAGMFNKDKAIKDITVFATIFATIYLVVISGAKTQVYWYLLPAYPFLSILVGVFLYTVCRLLTGINNMKEILVPDLPTQMLSYIFLWLVLFIPYQKTCDYVLSNISDVCMPQERHNIQLYLQGILHKEDKNMDGTSFLEDGFEQDLEWYVMALQQEHRPFKMVSREKLQPDEKVVAFLPESRKFLEDNYNFSVLSGFHNVVLYKLHGKKVIDTSATKK